MSKYTTPTVQMLRADHRRLETAVANLHDTIGSHVEDLADVLEERADLLHRCQTLEADAQAATHNEEQLLLERDELQAEVQRLRDENDELRAGRTTWPRGRGVEYHHAILPDGRVVSGHEAQHIKDGDPETQPQDGPPESACHATHGAESRYCATHCSGPACGYRLLYPCCGLCMEGDDA